VSTFSSKRKRKKLPNVEKLPKMTQISSNPGFNCDQSPKTNPIAELAEFLKTFFS